MIMKDIKANKNIYSQENATLQSYKHKNILSQDNSVLLKDVEAKKIARTEKIKVNISAFEKDDQNKKKK